MSSLLSLFAPMQEGFILPSLPWEEPHDDNMKDCLYEIEGASHLLVKRIHLDFVNLADEILEDSVTRRDLGAESFHESERWGEAVLPLYTALANLASQHYLNSFIACLCDWRHSRAGEPVFRRTVPKTLDRKSLRRNSTRKERRGIEREMKHFQAMEDYQLALVDKIFCEVCLMSIKHLNRSRKKKEKEEKKNREGKGKLRGFTVGSNKEEETGLLGDVSKYVLNISIEYLKKWAVPPRSLAESHGELLERTKRMYMEIIGVVSQITFKETITILLDEISESEKNQNIAQNLIEAFRYVKLRCTTQEELDKCNEFVNSVLTSDLRDIITGKKEMSRQRICETLSTALASSLQHRRVPEGMLDDSKYFKNVDQMITIFHEPVKAKAAEVLPTFVAAVCMASKDSFFRQVDEITKLVTKAYQDGSARTIGLECGYRLLAAFCRQMDFSGRDDKSELGHYISKFFTSSALYPLASERKKLKAPFAPAPFVVEESVDVLVDIIDLLSVIQVPFAAKVLINFVIEEDALTERKAIGIIAFLKIAHRLDTKAFKSPHSHEYEKKVASRKREDEFRRNCTKNLSRQKQLQLAQATTKTADMADDIAAQRKLLNGQCTEMVAETAQSLLQQLQGEPYKRIFDVVDEKELMSEKCKIESLLLQAVLRFLGWTVPKQLSLERLADLLCKFSIHYSPGVRRETRNLILQQLVKKPTDFLLVMFRSFCKMLLDISEEQPALILPQLELEMVLFDKQASTSSFCVVALFRSSPLFIKSPKKKRIREFDHGLSSEIEGITFIYLCHADTTLREAAWQILMAVHAVYTALIPKTNEIGETPRVAYCPISQVMLESESTILANCAVKRPIYPWQPQTVEVTAKTLYELCRTKDPKSKEYPLIWTRALADILRLTKFRSPLTVLSCWSKLRDKLEVMNGKLKDATTYEVDTLVTWRNCLASACAIMSPGFPGVETTLSPHTGILIFLKSELSGLRKAVGMALGFIGSDIFEMLFERCAQLERISDITRPRRKGPDGLRFSLLSVYRSASEVVTPNLLALNSGSLLKKFCTFLKSWLSPKGDTLTSREIVPEIRFNLCIFLSNILKHLHSDTFTENQKNFFVNKEYRDVIFQFLKDSYQIFGSKSLTSLNASGSATTTSTGITIPVLPTTSLSPRGSQSGQYKPKAKRGIHLPISPGRKKRASTITVTGAPHVGAPAPAENTEGSGSNNTEPEPSPPLPTAATEKISLAAAGRSMSFNHAFQPSLSSSGTLPVIPSAPAPPGKKPTSETSSGISSSRLVNVHLYSVVVQTAALEGLAGLLSGPVGTDYLDERSDVLGWLDEVFLRKNRQLRTAGLGTLNCFIKSTKAAVYSKVLWETCLSKCYSEDFQKSKAYITTITQWCLQGLVTFAFPLCSVLCLIFYMMSSEAEKVQSKAIKLLTYVCKQHLNVDLRSFPLNPNLWPNSAHVATSKAIAKAHPQIAADLFNEMTYRILSITVRKQQNLECMLRCLFPFLQHLDLSALATPTTTDKLRLLKRLCILSFHFGVDSKNVKALWFHFAQESNVVLIVDFLISSCLQHSLSKKFLRLCKSVICTLHKAFPDIVINKLVAKLPNVQTEAVTAVKANRRKDSGSMTTIERDRKSFFTRRMRQQEDKEKEQEKGEEKEGENNQEREKEKENEDSSLTSSELLSSMERSDYFDSRENVKEEKEKVEDMNSMERSYDSLSISYQPTPISATKKLTWEAVHRFVLGVIPEAIDTEQQQFENLFFFQHKEDESDQMTESGDSSSNISAGKSTDGYHSDSESKSEINPRETAEESQQEEGDSSKKKSNIKTEKSTDALAEPSKFTRGDIAQILTAQLTTISCSDNDTRSALIPLLHSSFLALDGDNAMLRKHASILLANLLHSQLVGTTLDDKPIWSEVEDLIQLLNVNEKKPVWTRLTPVDQFTSFVKRVLRVFTSLVKDSSFKDKWIAEAFKWTAYHSSSETKRRALSEEKPDHPPPNQPHLYHRLHQNRIRSYQIIRAIGPDFNAAIITSVVDEMISYKQNQVRSIKLQLPPQQIPPPSTFIELCLILESLLDIPSSLLTLSHLFWIVVGLLHTNIDSEYGQVLKLLVRLSEKLDFEQSHVVDTIMLLHPKTRAEPGSIISGPSFTGIQPVILKGMTIRVTSGDAIKLLTSLLPPRCLLPAEAVDPSPTRLLTSMLALFPFVVTPPFKSLRSDNPEKLMPSLRDLSISQLKNDAFHQEDNNGRLQRKNVCSKVAQSLENDYPALSSIWSAYEKEQFISVTTISEYEERVQQFVSKLGAEISRQFFPDYNLLTFGIIIEILKTGSEAYEWGLLLLLNALLKHTEFTPNSAMQNKGKAFFASLPLLLRGSSWQQALMVAESLLERSGVLKFTKFKSGDFVEQILENYPFDYGSTWSSTPNEKVVSPICSELEGIKACLNATMPKEAFKDLSAGEALMDGSSSNSFSLSTRRMLKQLQPLPEVPSQRGSKLERSSDGTEKRWRRHTQSSGTAAGGGTPELPLFSISMGDPGMDSPKKVRKAGKDEEELEDDHMIMEGQRRMYNSRIGSTRLLAQQQQPQQAAPIATMMEEDDEEEGLLSLSAFSNKKKKKKKKDARRAEGND